jgi:hypothetical protein
MRTARRALPRGRNGRFARGGPVGRVVVESERAAQSCRAVIEEVLAQDPPRFRVRWDDGRTSIFAPLGRCREDRAAQERAREGLTLRDARRYHECTGSGARSRSAEARRVLLPARRLLLLLHLQADHRRLRPGS